MSSAVPLSIHNDSMLAERVRKVFLCLPRAHGTSFVIDDVDDEGKRGALDPRTVRKPVTSELWKSHIDGEYDLGVLPLLDDSNCYFGVIDIDSYLNFDLAGLATKIAELGLWLVPCRSKSGGAHLYFFTVEPVTAASLRRRLRQYARDLGLEVEGPKAVEIFPKSDEMEKPTLDTPEPCTGGWARAPYFGGDTTDRYAVRPDGTRMSLTEFLDSAEAIRYLPLSEVEPEPESKPKKDYQRGAGEGNRYQYIKSAAGKHLQTYPDKNADQLIAYLEYERRSVMNPPVSDGEWRKWNIPKLCRRLIAKQGEQGTRGEKGMTREELGLDIAEDIRDNFILAQDAVGQIHFYDEETGRYVFDQHKQCIKILRDRYRLNKKAFQISDSDLKRLLMDLRVDAPTFWEEPPLDRINLKNGIFNLKTNVLEPHTSEFLYPNQFDVEYDPSAGNPDATDAFLRQILPDDAADVFYEILGCCLFPDVSFHKAFLLNGTGGNGKSAFIKLLLFMLGEANYSTVPLDQMEGDKFAAADLVGKLVNIDADLTTKRMPESNFFKKVTGGDPVRVQRKYQDGGTVKLYSRLILSCNYFPRCSDNSPGFFDRFLVMVFNKRNFRNEDAGMRLPEDVLLRPLKEEAPKILLKAVRAYQALRRRGSFSEGTSMKVAAAEFRSLTDSVAAWLAKNTIVRADVRVQQKQLREAYNAFCESKDVSPIGEKEFSAKVIQYQPSVTTDRAHGIHYFCGIGLKAESRFEQHDLVNH